MSIELSAPLPRLERYLATLLHYGTWVASFVIGVGLVLAYLDAGQYSQNMWGMAVIQLGVGLFILLPVLRLVLMLFVFLHERDYHLSLITALVLVVIIVGSLLGYYLPPTS